MTNTPPSHDMTDDTTRRRIFWLLQRLTSFSLWKRKRDAFAIFANEYESAVKNRSADDPEPMPANNLPMIFEICSRTGGASITWAEEREHRRSEMQWSWPCARVGACCGKTGVTWMASFPTSRRIFSRQARSHRQFRGNR